MYRSQERGFTLIELLVVVAIISMLSSFVLTSLNSARAKGRNAMRLQEINAYTRAMELFQSNGGRYPDGGVNWASGPSFRCLGRSSSQDCFAAGYTGEDALNAQIAPNLSKAVPGVDTGLALGGYAYRCIVANNGDPCYQYTIIYQLEGAGQTCAGGLPIVSNYLNQGLNTYCQVIQCAQGKSPFRSLPTAAYTCQ